MAKDNTSSNGPDKGSRDQSKTDTNKPGSSNIPKDTTRGGNTKSGK